MDHHGIMDHVNQNKCQSVQLRTSPNNEIYWKRVRHSVIPAILISNSSIEFVKFQHLADPKRAAALAAEEGQTQYDV